MIGHVISYSSRDGRHWALRLHDALVGGPRPVPVWLDVYDLQPGVSWKAQISEAIRQCDSLLFVMTADSVRPESVCDAEIDRALRYKKPIIPLQFQADLEPPMTLGARQWIDFRDFRGGMARLREHLDRLGTPEGELLLLKDRYSRALRDLENDDSDPRLLDEIRELEERISRTEQRLDKASSAREQADRSISDAMERERRARTRTDDPHGIIIVNRPTDAAPTYFQDRHGETERLGRHLRGNSKRIIHIVGRKGAGKSAMVCRLLEALEHRRLPDDGGPLEVDAIVFLSATPPLSVTSTALLDYLNQLLPPKDAAEAEAYLRAPAVPSSLKLQRLVSKLPQRLIIVLIENFENLVDPSTATIRDPELDQTLRALLELPQQHAVKLVITTQPPPPRALVELRPGRQGMIEIGDGLPPEEARLVLVENDEDGILGLRDAPESLLREAYELTGGNPRALEHIVGILRADRHTSLAEILRDTADKLRRDVAQALLGEAFSRLDRPTQQVVQALAVYGRRVTAPAINYLLQPYLPGFNCLPYLQRLVNMRFVRKDGEWYRLSQLDAGYALGEVPRGTVADRTSTAEPPPFTQLVLFHRAAGYFRETRHEPDTITSIDDLLPQLTEIELLYQGGEYDAAARVLKGIDRRYLLRWGHIRKLHEEHARLRGRLLDPDLSKWNLRMLARSLLLLGDNDGAIELYRIALERAREAGDLNDERKCLNNLGSCHFKLGDTERAAASYRAALAIAERTGQRKGEGRARSGIGLCLARQGSYEEAATQFEAALEIARQTGDSLLECNQLINLGTLSTGFGETDRAQKLLDQALWTARKAGLRSAEGASLAESAEVLIDCGRLEEAIQQARAAVRIAHDTESRELAYSANYVLAVAHLLHGDLNDARVTAEVAQLGRSTRAHTALDILGIVALRCGDDDAAVDAFGRAEGLAGTAAEEGRGGFEALDALGLARTGSALCGLPGKVKLALDAYRKARLVTSHQGITGRVGKLLDSLSPTDGAGVLEIIRPVATATSSRSGA